MQGSEEKEATREGWVGDSNYHRRHHSRSEKRAERIACHLSCASNFLDVGCNEGLVSEYLLRTGKVEKATGIELSDAKLSKWLSESDSFEFIKGDVENIVLEEKYDCIFYGAVHHHIVRESGFPAAINVFKKLAYSCADKIYFETGQLAEGGRWQWQREIYKNFSNDEEHFWFLLQSIEPILKNFKVIGRFYIHGVRRYLCEISVEDRGVEEEESCIDFEFSSIKNQEDFIKNPNIENGLDANDKAINNLDPFFRKIKTNEGSFFVKQRMASPHVDFLEYKIGRQIDFEWFVRPLGLSSSGIVFPWVDAMPLMKAKGIEKYKRKKLIDQLDTILEDAKSKKVELVRSLLIGRKNSRMFDVVDFNVRNFLFDGDNLFVVDVEYFSDGNSSRNILHFSKLYFRLGAFTKSAKLAFLGSGIRVLLSIKSFFFPFEIRVLRRSPSLISWSVARIRWVGGVALIRIFPSLAEK